MIERNSDIDIMCDEIGYYDDDGGDCQRCDEFGQIVACPDDMCRATGWCIHGDGVIVCPDCKGEGKL